jgi:hypothetical protein
MTGVPHTEVDLILANGRSVKFTYRVEDGDRISVYPVFEAFDIAGLSRVRPAPLRDTRFVLDVHLGRLGGYLRLLGFDTLANPVIPFSRCLRCNARLERRRKNCVLRELPPAVALRHEEFLGCPVCGRLYWKGSYFHR